LNIRYLHPSCFSRYILLFLFAYILPQAVIAQKNINTGRFILATNGFGVGYSHHMHEGEQLIFADIQTINHPLETNMQNPNTVNPKAYTFAKINSAASLRIGYTAYRLLSNGSNSSLSPQILGGISAGPSLGIIKPYYISYQHNREDGSGADIIQQNEETIHNSDSIYGPVSWTKGFNELAVSPGIHADIHIAINWNHSYYIQSCKMGVRLDYFLNNLNILYTAQNQYFTSIYIAYEIGR
jgi:hypothetical protein